jgi:RHS repeat-associated protein
MFIGRIRPDNTREYYLKNHQGSLIKSVQASGEDMYILDYMAYGLQTLHHTTDGDVPSEQYTGKEYDPFLAFYYYGARYFDPVLGMWSVPDPAGQFANPYYFGGDPVNYVDPDGEWVHIAVGAIIGAGVGAYQAVSNGHGLTDWQTYAYIGGGAAIGAGTAATGGAIAGAAGTGASTTAMIGYGAAGGATAGAMGGAANYTLAYGIETGGSFQGYNGADLWTSTWTGAVAGGIGSKLNGGSFWGGFVMGAGMGLASSALSSGLTPSMEFDGNNIAEYAKNNGLQEGDIIGFDSDGSAISNTIKHGSGEDITHVGIIERDASGALVIREAIGSHESIQTNLSEYSNESRNFKVLGNRSITQQYNYAEGGYNLVETNCTSQVTRWTGQGFINNPGVLYRNMNGIQSYYNSYHWGL